MDAYRIRIFFIYKPLRINSAVITLVHLQLFIYKIMQSFLLQWKWGDTTFPFSSLPRLFELFAAVKSFFFSFLIRLSLFEKCINCTHKRCNMSIKKVTVWENVTYICMKQKWEPRFGVSWCRYSTRHGWYGWETIQSIRKTLHSHTEASDWETLLVPQGLV